MTTKTIASVGLALILTALTITNAEARRHRPRGLICGATQAHYFGVGSNLALQWAKDFPHTSTPAVDVVVVQRRNGLDSAGKPGGHVSRIVQPISQCRAIVVDEKRRPYERDICKGTVALVVPRAGTVAALTDMPRSRHKHKHAGRIQIASHAAPDRHSVQ